MTKTFNLGAAWTGFICNFNYQLPAQEWALRYCGIVSCVMEISRGMGGSGRENHPSQLHYGYNIVISHQFNFSLYNGSSP